MWKLAPFLAWRRFLPVNDWDSNIPSAITHTSQPKNKKSNRKYRESHISKKTKTVEKCEVPEMKVGGEDEETGRPIKR